MNFLDSYYFIIQDKSLQVQKIKKPALKRRLYFGKWDFLASSIKNSYISGNNFKAPSLKKFLMFFSYFIRVSKNKYIHSL